MDALAILSLVAKGLAIVEVVWDNRELAMKAFESVKNIVDNHTTITEDDLVKVEADLDALLDEFNAPLPPE